MNRELDVQVAKVKGLGVVGEGWYRMAYNGFWYKVSETLDGAEKHPVYNKGKYLDIVPFWSSNLLTAWELVDEATLECVDFKLERKREWLATFDWGNSYASAYAKTAQEAICKTYLRWKEGMKDG